MSAEPMVGVAMEGVSWSVQLEPSHLSLCCVGCEQYRSAVPPSSPVPRASACLLVSNLCCVISDSGPESMLSPRILGSS